MPRMSTAIYAAHQDNVLKLAQREGGVSRIQIVDELNVTRAIACGLIEKIGLVVERKEGRTEFFVPGEPKPVSVKQSPAPLPPEVDATVVPDTDDTGGDQVDLIAELDAQILDTRNTLHNAADKAGKALGEWATHSALVDALRERLSDLAVKRMAASS